MGNRKNTFRIAVRSFGPFELAIKKQWDIFTSGIGESIELEAVPFDLHPLHETLFENEGLRKGEWDVAFVSTDWIAEASSTNALADVTNWLRSDPPDQFPSGWPDSLLRMQSIEGKKVGLPYHDGPECLIYRTDLLAGESDLPQTWDEFRETARRLHSPSRKLYGTAFAAYPDGHNTVYDFCLQLWSRGGDLFAPDGSMQLFTPQGAEALRFYRSMINDVSAVHPQCRGFDSVKSGLAFAAGEIAMMVNWFGFAAMSETIQESKVKGKVGIARIPSQGGPHISLNSYWILGIASGSELQQLAWHFLKHCATASMDKLLTLEGAIGCRKSTWQDPDINAIIPFYNQLDRLHGDARELPRLSHWSALSEVIDEMMLQALNTIVPETELLAAAQAKAEGLIAKAEHA
jgi:multiple sugar transport system substrate-binding protein